MSSYVKRGAQGGLFVTVMEALDDLRQLHNEVATTVRTVQEQFPDTFTDIPRWNVAVEAVSALQEALEGAGYGRHPTLQETLLNRLVYHAIPQSDTTGAVYLQIAYQTRKQTNFRQVSQIVRLGNVVDRLQAAGDAVNDNHELWVDEEGTKIAATLRYIAAIIKDADFPQMWG